MPETLAQWATQQPIVRGTDPQAGGAQLDRKPRQPAWKYPYDGNDFTMYRRWEFLQESVAQAAVDKAKADLQTEIVMYPDPAYEDFMAPEEVRRRFLAVITLPDKLAEIIGEPTITKPVGPSLFSIMNQPYMGVKGKFYWLDHPDSSGNVAGFKVQ